MLAVYIRSIDKKHLIALGSEGWFGMSDPSFRSLNPPTVEKQPIDWNATEGSDFIRNHNLPNIDICTFRLWNHWLSDEVNDAEQQGFWRAWIEGHLHASEKYLNKPVLLEEFGVRHTPVDVRDTYFKLVYDAVENAVSARKPTAGTCFWMLSDDGMLCKPHEVVTTQ